MTNSLNSSALLMGLLPDLTDLALLLPIPNADEKREAQIALAKQRMIEAFESGDSAKARKFNLKMTTLINGRTAKKIKEMQEAMELD